MTITLNHAILGHYLLCPVCGTQAVAAEDAQLNPSNLHCTTCGTEHFAIDNILCLFPNGVHHKTLWQHQLGTMQAQGAAGLAQLQEAASRHDLTSTSRQRIADLFHALKHSQTNVLSLLTRAGLEPIQEPGLQQMELGDLAEYYDLILRDWAWGQAPNGYYPSGENRAALERLLPLLPAELASPASMLVLGAGAGRLSWDLHVELDSQCTIAFDSNPLLLLVADHLIRDQQPLNFSETRMFPQVNQPITHYWDLTPPEDPSNKRHAWFPLAGDVWSAPFKPASFDLIITPWFIDVTGGDVRDLIGTIQRLLKPGGLWINSGPLLFTRHLPLQLKYQNTEILEFLDFCGFDLLNERLDSIAHLASPIEVRARIEQVWSFCARAPNHLESAISTTTNPPAWLVMHHLIIPQQTFYPSQQHPLIDTIVQLVDGNNSINSISAAVAPYIPDDISAKDAVATILGQMVLKAGSL